MRNIRTTRSTDVPATARDELIHRIQDEMAVLRGAAERRRVRRLLGRSVSLTHLHVLTVLRSQGPMPVSALASILDVSVASTTGIVSRMEERSLVARSRSSEDARVVTVSLAEGGEGALDELSGRSREYFEDLLGRLSLEELETVRDGFHALNRARAERAADEAADANDAADADKTAGANDAPDADETADANDAPRGEDVRE